MKTYFYQKNILVIYKQVFTKPLEDKFKFNTKYLNHNFHSLHVMSDVLCCNRVECLKIFFHYFSKRNLTLDRKLVYIYSIKLPLVLLVQ